MTFPPTRRWTPGVQPSQPVAQPVPIDTLGKAGHSPLELDTCPSVTGHAPTPQRSTIRPFLLETHTAAFIPTPSNTYAHDEATVGAKNHAQVTSRSCKTMKNEQRPGTTLVTSWKTMPSRRRRETAHRIPGGAKKETVGNPCYLLVKDEKEQKLVEVAAASTR